MPFYKLLRNATRKLRLAFDDLRRLTALLKLASMQARVC